MADGLDPVVYALDGTAGEAIMLGPGQDAIEMRPEHADDFLEELRADAKSISQFG